MRRLQDTFCFYNPFILYDLGLDINYSDETVCIEQAVVDNVISSYGQEVDCRSFEVKRFVKGGRISIVLDITKGELGLTYLLPNYESDIIYQSPSDITSAARRYYSEEKYSYTLRVPTKYIPDAIIFDNH
jgi:hypothetical protein